MSSRAKPRKRNPRGEGSKLRDEIVQAALRLVDAEGVEALSLRAVAREAGISAPSIYDHFADLSQISSAVVGQCFAELTAEIAAARTTSGDPVEQFEAGCWAYLRFAQRQPARYELLFKRARPEELGEEDRGAASGAFETLVTGISACVAAGRSSSTDPFGDAVALWSALHGFAGLRTTVARFPWPEDEATVRRIVYRLARIDERS